MLSVGGEHPGTSMLTAPRVHYGRGRAARSQRNSLAFSRSVEGYYFTMHRLHLRSDHPAHAVMGAAAPTPTYYHR